VLSITRWCEIYRALRALVRAAFLAALRRFAAPRLRALVRACRESDAFDAALVPSRLRAFVVARDLFGEGACRELAASESCLVLVRTAFEVLPLGGCKGTPARRALERPIAMACFVERAPCFPSRM